MAAELSTGVTETRWSRLRRGLTAMTAAGSLALTAAACDIYQQPPVNGKNVLVVGDSLINRMGPYISQDLLASGFTVDYVGGMEGHWESGGPADKQPSGQALLADPNFQAKVKAADIVVEAFGTNDQMNGVPAIDMTQRDLTLNATVWSINPHARRYMTFLATSNPYLRYEFSLANQARQRAAQDPHYGFDTINMEAIWCNGADPMLIPVDCPTLETDVNGIGIHPATVAGLQQGAAGIVNTLRNTEHTSLTYVMPQYQGNGNG